jgi:hypothetical protein
MPQAKTKKVAQVGGSRFSNPEAAKEAKRLLEARGQQPTERERKAMQASRSRNEERGDRAKVFTANLPDDEGTIRFWFGEHHSDKEGWLDRVQDAFGTSSEDFAQKQLTVLATMAKETGDGRVSSDAMNSMLAAVDGVRPKNEIEAQLAVQMATTHAFAMTCLRGANGSDTIQQLEANGISRPRCSAPTQPRSRR